MWPVRMWPGRPCARPGRAALRATFKSVPPCRDGTHSARDARASPTLSTTALAAPAVAPTAIATAAITATSVASGLCRGYFAVRGTSSDDAGITSTIGGSIGGRP